MLCRAYYQRRINKMSDTSRYYGEQISENRIRTPEGYLVCLNVPIAATEPMEYNNEDVGLETDKEIVLIRNPWEELSNPRTIASFEAKPVTLHHPDSQILDVNTTPDEIVGVCVNVRADEVNKVLIADLVIIDNEAIAAVLSGIKEVSCGYTATTIDNGDGTGYRTNIVGNHVAIVPAGRCGVTCSISDSNSNSEEKKVDKKTILETLKSWVKDADEPAKGDDFDAKAAFEALSKQVTELTAKLTPTPDATEPTPATPDDKLSQVLELLQKLLEIENAKSVSNDDDIGDDDDDDDDDEDVNDAKNVKIVLPKVNDGADSSAMTPAKLNAVAEQFYKRSK
jgi:hypothetical protein